MKPAVKIAVVTGIVAVLAAAAGIGWFVLRGPDTYEVEKTRVEPAKPPDLLADDKLEDKHPEFDPELIDSRPFGEHDNPWQINASAAVIRLDVPDIRNVDPQALRELYPDYVSAAKALEAAGYQVLPSVNLLRAKAKQFDDGLYAAMDMYMAHNNENGVRDVELCVRQVLTEMMPTGEAYAWLWGALEVGGFVSGEEYQRRPARAEKYIAGFMANKAASEPVGFYNWNANLQRVFRFLRYLQQPFKQRQGSANVLAQALRRNAQAREQYQRMLNLYRRLTNPFVNLSLLALIDDANEGRSLEQIAEASHLRRAEVAFLPSSDSPETELFDRLYPNGVPAGADLMMDLIRAIRDGKVDLTPKPNSGWYDYQLHALETLLLSGKGVEHDKLLLTKKYKLRLVEAFKSMVTKTRETHIRQLAEAVGSSAPAPRQGLSPRLRLEPNPTFYLRIARSYTFIQNILMATVHDLNSLHTWSSEGPRELPLGDELERIRQLYYGLYLVSCEDIGLKPELLKGEGIDPVYQRVIAADWLKKWQDDPDLAVDTRVAVPIYRMPGKYTRFWCTVGVRPIRLRASYAKEPSWRPTPKPDQTPAKWEEIPAYELRTADWVILGDDFVEARMQGDATLTRKQLREVCDRYESKQEIAAALGR